VNLQPAIPSQALQRFAQGWTGDTQPDGEFAFGRQGGVGREGAVQDGADQPVLGDLCGFLWRLPGLISITTFLVRGLTS